MAGGKVRLVRYPPQRQGAGRILLPANTSEQKVSLQKAQPSPILVFQPPIPISVVRNACLMAEQPSEQVCLPVTLTIVPAHPLHRLCVERAPMRGFMEVTMVVLQSPWGSQCHQRQRALCFRWGWKLWILPSAPLHRICDSALCHRAKCARPQAGYETGHFIYTSPGAPIPVSEHLHSWRMPKK